MSIWTKKKFGELYSTPSRNGVSKPSRVRGSGYPMVNMKEIFLYDRITDEQDMELVPLSEGELQSGMLISGDLLFARQSLVIEGAGKCSIYLGKKRREVTFESHLIRVRLDGKVANPIFYYYYFSSPLGKLNVRTIVNQVAAAGIRGSDLERLLVPATELSTQTRIASIVSIYDDLIENNEKRIKTLEQMAELLYIEWFVKFKFPGHEKVKLVDSGTSYGKIPEGWEVVTIESLLGKVKRKPKIPAGEYLKTGVFPIVDQGREFIAGYTNDESAVYNEDLIVFGDHSRCFKYCNFPFACGSDGTQLLLTNDRERMPEMLLYYFVKNSGLQNFNYARHFKFLKSLQVLKPTKVIARSFSDFVDSAYHQIESLRNRNINLSKTRDLLIPQLVTGKRELKNI